MSWFEVISYLVINYSGLNPFILMWNVIHFSCSCSVNCTELLYLFIGWGEVNKLAHFGVADLTVGEGTVLSYERQCVLWWWSKTFWTNQEVSFLLYNKTLNYFINRFHLNIWQFHFTVFSCQKIHVQDTCNFVCKYKMTLLFSDDEWGKNFVWYVGKCSTLCTEI